MDSTLNGNFVRRRRNPLLAAAMSGLLALTACGGEGAQSAAPETTFVIDGPVEGGKPAERVTTTTSTTTPNSLGTGQYENGLVDEAQLYLGNLEAEQDFAHLGTLYGRLMTEWANTASFDIDKALFAPDYRGDMDQIAQYFADYRVNNSQYDAKVRIDFRFTKIIDPAEHTAAYTITYWDSVSGETKEYDVDLQWVKRLADVHMKDGSTTTKDVWVLAWDETSQPTE